VGNLNIRILAWKKEGHGLVRTAELELLNPKKTSQQGLLERPLTWLRTRKVRGYVQGKKILDFGCGAHLTTLRSFRAVAKGLAGFDVLFQGLPPQVSPDGIPVYGDLDQIEGSFDVVTALACFEHIDQAQLPLILQKLRIVLSEQGLIVGTVPRPPSRPVLEFLSYKLGLIDPTQIADHKVYYDQRLLQETAAQGGFSLHSYQIFQLGFNSLFVLRPHR
jgi:SAM-dependent methyltransferase